MQYWTFLGEKLQTAASIAEQYRGHVSGVTKAGDPNQVLTEADLAVGRYLVAAVQETYPDHNVLDEEAGSIDKGSQFTWVIDPIEATSNFAAGLPQYGIMMGLLKKGTPIAGGIIAPAYKKLYLAEKGKGAACNGEPIHVTKETKLINTLVSFGIDGQQDNPERTRAECAVLADLILAIRNMRNTGCEALDPMYVAEGRFGGRVNTSGKIWDSVAPHIIAQEAGALWTTANGQTPDYSQPLTRLEENFSFCVASPALHKQLQAIIGRRLNA